MEHESFKERRRAEKVIQGKLERGEIDLTEAVMQIHIVNREFINRVERSNKGEFCLNCNKAIGKCKCKIKGVYPKDAHK